MKGYKIVKFKGDYIILPTEEKKCPFCDHKMLFHDFAVFNSLWGWYYCDLHLKCASCGFYATFGIPLGEEEFLKLINSRWHQKVFDIEIVELYPEEEKVKERLESWGYW